MLRKIHLHLARQFAPIYQIDVYRAGKLSPAMQSVGLRADSARRDRPSFGGRRQTERTVCGLRAVRQQQGAEACGRYTGLAKRVTHWMRHQGSSACDLAARQIGEKRRPRQAVRFCILIDRAQEACIHGDVGLGRSAAQPDEGYGQQKAAFGQIACHLAIGTNGIE